MAEGVRWEEEEINAERTEDAEFTEKSGKNGSLRGPPAGKRRRSGRDDVCFLAKRRVACGVAMKRFSDERVACREEKIPASC